LIVGHENNLRSIIKQLEGIDDESIINLSLPRAVPLAYRLDLDTLKPLDDKVDEATGFLHGEWLGGDETVAKILDRDNKQVYDTKIKHNLEKGAKWNKWRDRMESLIGEDSFEQKAKSAHSCMADGGMVGDSKGIPRYEKI